MFSLIMVLAKLKWSSHKGRFSRLFIERHELSQFVVLDSKSILIFSFYPFQCLNLALKNV